VTANEILSRVASARGTSVTRLRSRTDSRALNRIRHEAMWLLRESTEMSYPEIARLMGRKDHTTALHGVRKIQALVEADPVYHGELLALASPRHTEMVAFEKRAVAALRAQLAEREARLRDLVGRDVEIRAVIEAASRSEA
jgi:dephospho-CoA kinase